MENSDQNFLSSSSSSTSNPLFSIFITINTLILLYSPQIFLKFIFSLLLIFTQFLLLIVLQLSSIQKPESESKHDDPKWVQSKTEIKPEKKLGFNSNQNLIDSFVEWNVRAPLEVIYEAYEGEEDEEKEKNISLGFDNLQRYPSLSMYYPESGSESSSDGEFGDTGERNPPEKMCFKWNEDDRGELIEIALDDEKNSGFDFDFDSDSDFDYDEDNMIEIDVSTP